MREVGLLGPVTVTVAAEVRPVVGLRRKAVLAALALQPGRIVSTDRIIDLVWGDAAPATVANTLQSHVSYLRRLLGDRSAIQARAPGYLLDADTALTVHETGFRAARAAGDVDAAARLAIQLGYDNYSFRGPAEAVGWAERALKLSFTEGDAADEDTLNRILWHAMKGYDTPYPERYAGGAP